MFFLHSELTLVNFSKLNSECTNFTLFYFTFKIKFTKVNFECTRFTFFNLQDCR